MSTLKSPDVNAARLRTLLAQRRELNDVEIGVMLRTIRPLVRRPDGLYYIKPVDSRRVSFIWDPQLDRKAGALRQVCQISTLHVFDHISRFKPSIAEVLCRIPQGLLPQVRAFEVFGPENQADLDRQGPAVEAGYHVATTVLYA